MDLEESTEIEKQNLENDITETAITDGLVSGADDEIDSPPADKPADEPEDKPADKPEDKKEEPAKSMLETVKARDLELKEEAGKKEETKPEDKTKEKEKEEQKTEAEIAAEEETKLKKGLEEGKISKKDFKKLPTEVKDRIGSLYREVKERDEEIARLTPQAGTAANLQKFVQESGMSQDDFKEGMNIMALRHSDPVAALAMLTPIFNELKLSVGDTLPDDIQVALDDGKIQEAEAKEMARLRAVEKRVKDAQAPTSAADPDQPTQAEIDAWNAQSRKTHDAVLALETHWNKTDPEFAYKRPLIRERVEYLFQKHGVPRTEAETLKLVEGAKVTIDARTAKRGNKTTVLKPVTPTTATDTKTAEPKSALEQCKMDEQTRNKAVAV